MFYFLLFFALSRKSDVDPKNVEYIDDGIRDRIVHNFTTDQIDLMQKNNEAHEYQADTNKVMGILIDNLYQNKDIFLRELISNANDALDKIRFQAIRDPSVLEDGPRNLEILIDVNEEQKTLSITDTGIGMTKEELIENLGRIAKSGTSEFQKMLQSGDTNLIGQFGVGFYSAFLVADKVTVISKSNNSTKQYIWMSDATSQFSVVEDPRGVTLGRGTSIILHLKDNCYGYVDRDRLISIIRHYSMFVDFPVKIWHFKDTYITESKKESTEEKSDKEDVFDNDNDVVVEEESSSDEEEEDNKASKSSQSKKKLNKKLNEGEYETIKRRTWQWIQINDKKPIWLRDPNEVSDSDYDEFFQIFYKEPKPPLLHTHFKAEGRVIFNALFFIPSVPPPAEKTFEQTTRNIRLYVKRILVADEWNDEILPTYLHFVKGVIDSNDLTLNVDRDRLIKLNTLKMIKRRVTSKVLNVLRNMFLNEPIKYADFYSKFSGNIKFGVVDDPANKQMLSKLLMFYTSYSPRKLTTLDDYVARMKKGQENIYWIGAASIDEAVRSPYMEDLLSQGYEVLFAIEPIDVHCFERMDEFDGIPLSNPEKRETSQQDEKIQDVSGFNITQRTFNRYVRWFKRVIGDRVDNVILSKRLHTTPAICISTAYGYTASHERLMRAQTVHDSKLDENLIMNHKILELNFEHPTIQDIFARIKKNQKDPEVIEDVRLLYDNALLAGGFTLTDSLNFTKRVFKMIGRSYGMDKEIAEFESENKVYTPIVEDEFEHAHKNDKRIKLVKPKEYKTSGELNDDGTDEKPADLNPETPPECYRGLL
ncbi:Hsp90 protein [Tritrichomonas foetus]|uniref:Hsp90 protein n=1 Tax=Tritrichomonas foetus TaxID=1144522 RepID=A0A1J4JK79_9EUKA|nr:Hsp90 protein [Tritrichomonas foetus]|eukprot:OHS99536.1 Hsp90 protein [Tritrichomonas foetus]